MNKLSDNSKLEQLYKNLNKDLYSCYKNKIDDDSDIAWNQAIYKAIRIINENIESLLTFEFVVEESKDVVEYFNLTNRECTLCNLLFKMGGGYLTRDENNKLHWFINKPIKNISFGEWVSNKIIISDNKCSLNMSDLYPECEFSFIKWEDKEPWEVPEIK